MDNINYLNPFSIRGAPTGGRLWAYRVSTMISWLVSVVPSIYYTYKSPESTRSGSYTIWEQNSLHPSTFTMNALIASLYFLALFVTQIVYMGHLFSSDSTKVKDAANVAPHYVFNNLLHFAFVMLFVRSHFGWAEFLVGVNLANMSACYFRHNTYALLIHWPAVSAPLAWLFVAMYWNGAIWLPSTTSLALRILGHVFIWSILAYGMFFMVLYKDYTMGFSFSILSAAIGVGQFLIKAVSLQWIFAFTIMSALFVTAIGIAVMACVGEETSEESEDGERAPLLAD